MLDICRSVLNIFFPKAVYLKYIPHIFYIYLPNISDIYLNDVAIYFRGQKFYMSHIYFIYMGVTHIAQNIAKTCQKYFQSLSQDVATSLSNIAKYFIATLQF